MADKTIVFNIDITGTDEQVKELAKLETQIASLVESNKKLKTNRKENATVIAQNNVALKKLRETQRNVNKQAQANIKSMKQQTGSLVEMRTKLRDLRTQYDNLSAAERNNTNVGGKLQKQIQGINRTLTKSEAATGRAQRGVGRYRESMKRLATQFIGVTVVIGLFTRAIGAAFRNFRDFGKLNSQLAAILGKTTEQTGALRDEATRLGGTTAFTSNQVVELQIELARLGKTQNEIIASTKGIINTSVALGSAAAETALLIGATLNAYKLSAEESTRVGDILTLSTQRTALNFEKLSTGLPIVAGAARAVGVSLEQLVSQLGQAADRGIDASTAATSLRNIYIRLKKQGISYNDALKQINASSDSVTESVKLFGVRAAVTGIALADTTERADDLTIAFGKAGGTSERVANTQLRNLDGRLILLTSAMDGFIKSLDDGETILGQFVSTAITEITKLLKLISQSDEFNEGLFTQEIADLGEKNIKRYKETLEKNVASIESQYTGSQLVMAAATKGFFRELAFSIGIHEDERYAMEKTRDAATELIEIKAKLRIINNLLAKETEESIDPIDPLNEETAATKSLLEVQKELLKQAKELPETTEAEVAARNRKIEAINTEIARLKTLGTIKEEQRLADELEKEVGTDESDLAILSDELDAEYDLITGNIKNVNDAYKESAEFRAQLTEIANEKELDAITNAAKAKVSVISAAEGAILGILGDSVAGRLAAIAIQTLAEIASIKITTAAAQARNLANAAAPGPPQNIPLLITAAAQNGLLAANSAAAIAQVGIGAAVKGALALIPRPSATKVKFARGGVFSGASHAQGGIKAGGVEVEGGEPVLTKSVTSDPTDLATISAINVRHGGVPLTNYTPKSYMARGGNVPDQGTQQASTLLNAMQDLKVTLNVHELTQAQNNIQILSDAGTF